MEDRHAAVEAKVSTELMVGPGSRGQGEECSRWMTDGEIRSRVSVLLLSHGANRRVTAHSATNLNRMDR